MNVKIKFALKTILVAIIYLGYLQVSAIGIYDPASLQRLLEGTAYRPFAYRVLMPQLSIVLSKIIPFEVSSANLPTKLLRQTFLHLNGDIYPREAFWILMFIFFSMLGFVYVEERFLSDLGFSNKTKAILPLFILSSTLLFTINFGYMYDIPQLFLMTASLWLLFRRHWILYLCFFAIATLNKETSILLITLYLIYFSTRLEKKPFRKLLVGQIFIYVLLRFSLFFAYHTNPNFFAHYAGNPGHVIWPTLADHLYIYTKRPITLIVLTSLFFIVFILVRKNWRKKNDFLKAGIMIPVVLLLLYFWGGTPMEIRVFYEALPILGVLIFDPDKL